MTNPTTGTGIAGAMEHAKPAPGSCYVCGGPAESSFAGRALYGVGLVVVCSAACAEDQKFMPPHVAMATALTEIANDPDAGESARQIAAAALQP